MSSGNVTAADDGEPWTRPWDNETCKMEDWGTRLTDTEYIGQPFLQWGNILIIFWTLLLAYSSRWVFSQPFLAHDKATKADRVAARDARREKRKALRRRMRKLKAKALTVGGGMAAAVKLAKAQAEEGNAEEDAGEAKGDGDADGGGVELTPLSPVDVVVDDGTAADQFAVFRSFDYQMVQGDNKAMGLLYAGFVVSLMLGCSGPRSPVDYDDPPLDSFVDFLLYSIIAYVLLGMAIVVQSKLLLPKVEVCKSLLQGNLSTAVTLAGICLATGINLNVSFVVVVVAAGWRVCLLDCPPPSQAHAT